MSEEIQRTDSVGETEFVKKRVCLYVVAAEDAFGNTAQFLNQQLALVQVINNTPGWQYERIYMDVNGEHIAFNEMIDDCSKGRFDIIVTKSILHFAGNVSATMDVAERLAALEPPVEIIFTDEAVFTFDSEKLNDIRKSICGADKKLITLSNGQIS